MSRAAPGHDRLHRIRRARILLAQLEKVVATLATDEWDGHGQDGQRLRNLGTDLRRLIDDMQCDILAAGHSTRDGHDRDVSRAADPRAA